MFLYPHTHYHHGDDNIHILYEDVKLLKDWIFLLSQWLGEIAEEEKNDYKELIEEITTLANKIQDIFNDISKKFQEVADKFAEVDNRLDNIEEELDELQDELDDLREELEKLENQVSELTNKVNYIYNIVTGSTTGTTKLTEGTDYTVTSWNGWTFSPSGVYAYTDDSGAVTGLIIVISRTTPDLYHEATYDKSPWYIKHGTWTDEDGHVTGSRLFTITFKGDYSSCNNASFSVGNDDNFLLNISPTSERASWLAQVWASSKSQHDTTLTEGLTVGIGSYFDGYNAQFNRYSDDIYVTSAGNTLTIDL